MYFCTWREFRTLLHVASATWHAGLNSESLWHLYTIALMVNSSGHSMLHAAEWIYSCFWSPISVKMNDKSFYMPAGCSMRMVRWGMYSMGWVISRTDFDNDDNGHTGIKYGSRNVLADAAVREGIKKFSNWPTIPQVGRIDRGGNRPLRDRDL